MYNFFQCVTYIDPPKTTHLQGVQTPHMQLPIISSYTSMRTGPSRNRFNRRFPVDGNQSKSLTYVISGSK